MKKEVKKLIAKYFDQQLSSTEALELVEWVENGNIDVFNEYVMINYTIDEIEAVRQGPDLDLWDEIVKKIGQENKSGKSDRIIKLWNWKYAIAAAIAVLVTSAVFFFEIKPVDELQNVVEKEYPVTPGTDKAMLTLANGTRVLLEKSKVYSNDRLRSDGENLIYQSKNNGTPEVEYNYLTVPRGGQFAVQLVDGTKVWLNSESQLKYPVEFVPGESRIVELLYGEGYFDVTPSNRNNGSDFKVLIQNQEVQVFGTEFNVKAYRDEHIISTTLVEGSVSVNAPTGSVLLKPNNQSRLNIETGFLDVFKVDVFDEIAWKNGMFGFRDMRLVDIMKVLSRWYDINVRFENKKLENIRFNGSLRKDQNLDEILLTIKNINNINYELNGKELVLK